MDNNPEPQVLIRSDEQVNLTELVNDKTDRIGEGSMSIILGAACILSSLYIISGFPPSLHLAIYVSVFIPLGAALIANGVNIIRNSTGIEYVESQDKLENTEP